jgi:[ribosomal protein S18]-alanine N-acetyltransferase
MIREANFNDIDSIDNLGKLINDNFNNVFNVYDILENNISRIYVYEKNNKVIAFLHIEVLYENADIINIVVNPEYRNQYIASLLLSYMINNLNNNIETITLEVSADNTAALNLYKKFNFEIINERKNYYKNKNAYIMRKKMKNEN